MIVSASILSSDFSSLGSEVSAVDKAGSDYIHLDVMDGLYVPNITFGMPVIKSIRKYSSKIFDTHLMIENPSRYIDDFIAAGSDIITVHYEADIHLNRTASYIRSKGKKAGVSINPSTPVSVLEDILPYVDLVLIMTVNPGFAAQSMIATAYEKVSRMKAMITTINPSVLIEVDGGVNAETAPKLRAAGCDIVVAGNYIFTSGDYAKAISTLKNA